MTAPFPNSKALSDEGLVQLEPNYCSFSNSAHYTPKPSILLTALYSQTNYNTEHYILRPITILSTILSDQLQYWAQYSQTNYNTEHYTLKPITILSTILSNQLQYWALYSQTNYNTEHYTLKPITILSTIQSNQLQYWALYSQTPSCISRSPNPSVVYLHNDTYDCVWCKLLGIIRRRCMHVCCIS